MMARHKEHIERDLEYAEIIRSLNDNEFFKLLRAGMDSSLSDVNNNLPKKAIWKQLEREMQFENIRLREGWQGLFFKAFNQRVKNIMSEEEDYGGKNTYFTGCYFPIEMSLRDVECVKLLRFDGATFHGIVDFCQTSFVGVDFSSATFMNPVHYWNAKFDGKINFSGCKFHGRTTFDKSCFKQDPYFHQSCFHSRVSFDGAEFRKEVYFGGASFKSNASFAEAIFRGTASFTGCKDGWEEFSLIGNFDFSGAKFFRVPWFEGTAIRQDSSLPIAEYIPAPPNKIPEQKRETYWHQEENASRTLALAMGNIRNRPAEGKFHALELDARRQRPSTPWHQRCLLGIYSRMSQCGQSIFKPLAFLCFFFLAFMLWFKSAFAMCSSGNDALSSLDKGFKFAFQSIVPFYAQLKGESGSTLMIPDATLGCYLSFHIVSLLESLVAAGCLAMSIIALRWHLRRG